MSEVQRFYAGIGSRETPEPVLALMQHAAKVFAAKGWTLRSGHAPGADVAFELGADSPFTEVFLPWEGFNDKTPLIGRAVVTQPKWAEAIAAELHPAWARCKPQVRRFHARNTLQVTGERSPKQSGHVASTFVLAWAPLDGAGLPKGGTAQALRVADALGIRTFNLVDAQIQARVQAILAA